MPIDTILFKNKKYPRFQSLGFASQFSFPFANLICKGSGLDIGCMNTDWAFPGAHPIDIAFNDGHDAMNLPDGLFDYIYSSHCLEHLPDWVGALDYWKTKLDKGGVLFLYLPHPSQTYWRPHNNRKHIHILQPEYIEDYLHDRGWKNVFVSGCDLNNSFYAIAES